MSGLLTEQQLDRISNSLLTTLGVELDPLAMSMPSRGGPFPAHF
jgi:hypothetical protein